ncbi:MAG: alpha/beta hydrolase [Acidimicrobiales bacterium]|nr:alpha/beta hydrolase [Acidimicrobiales bacterium]
MAWAFFAVSMVAGALVVNAYAPVRREPWAGFCFAFGWTPSELPLHFAVLAVAATLAFVTAGALSGWPGWVGLGLTAASVAGLCGQAVVAARAGGVVDEALRTAFGPEAPEPVRPHWLRPWRMVVAVPFRFRGITRQRNIDYWGDGNYRHKLDVLRRRGPAPERAPVLVYVHGGAWVIGDKREQGIPLMHELVQRGWVCVSVNYRLSPRATWPAHVVDVKRAVAWVREHIDEYGGDPDFVAVAGGSAGGHLAALVALTPGRPEWQPGFEAADTSVDACLPFYGVYDMTGARDLMGTYGRGFLKLLESRVMKASLESDPALFEAASPDRQVTPEAPPFFVVHGTNDTLVPVAVARHFATQLRRTSASTVAYAELPLAQHAFEVLVSIRTRHAVLGAVRFLDAVHRRAGEATPPGRVATPVHQPAYGQTPPHVA